MPEYRIIRIHEQPEFISSASMWFHQKWGIPQSAYSESMTSSLVDGCTVPRWYVMLDGEKIIAGLGVIENDFHDRPDLTPNVCAVFVEDDFRGKGIAGRMLSFVCEDFSRMGIDTLYLLTDHVGFYERYGWEFYCMAQGDGDDELSRMYVHKA